MSDESFDFKIEADRMLLIARVLTSVNLNRITDVIEDAHTLGPILDPTKYRDAMYRGDLDDVNRLARSLKEPKRIMNEILAKAGLICGACGATTVRFDPADGMCCSSCGRCDSDE